MEREGGEKETRREKAWGKKNEERTREGRRITSSRRLTCLGGGGKKVEAKGGEVEHPTPI